MDEQAGPTSSGVTARKNSSPSCRRCARTIREADDHYPFCSERCRLADLNSWFDGDYKVSRAIKDSDIETVD